MTQVVVAGAVILSLALPLRASQQAAPLLVRVAPPEQEVEPGETVPVGLVLENASDASVLLRVNPQLPEGWQVAWPVVPIVLAPGDTAEVPLVVRIPALAPPGDYTLTLTVVDPGLYLRQDATCTVRVKPLPRAEVQVVSREVEAHPGSSVSVSVEAFNRGNVELLLRPSVAAPLGWVVAHPPDAIALPPGTSRRAAVRLQLPDSIGPGRYGVAMTLSDPAWHVDWHAYATVRVLAVRRVGIDLSAEPPDVAPGAAVAVRAQVVNSGNVIQRLRATVALPEGWRVGEEPSGLLLLSPGERATVTWHVMVAPGTRAGLHELTLRLVDERGAVAAKASTPVTVRAVTDLAAESLNPLVESAPGRPVALLARVTNEGNAPLHLEPEVEAPGGWRVVVPPPVLDLEPQEWQTALLSVLPPPEARAGRYELRVRWQEEQRGISATARFTVTVLPQSRLHVALLEAPAYTITESYRLRFGVQNAGNRAEAIELRVTESLGFATQVDPPTLLLGPGESASVTIRVAVPPTLPRTAFHRVQLTATSSENPEVRASANATVEVVARSAPEQAAYHWFPLTASWVGELAPEALRLTWRLAGSGRLRDTAAGRLSFAVSDESAQASYQLPRVSVAAGRQGFSLSPLTVFNQQGTGVEVRGRADRWEGIVQAFDAGHERRFGARLGYLIDPRNDASLQALAAPEPGLWLASVVARLSPSPRATLEGEYGCTAFGNEACAAHAAEVRTTFSRSPWAGSVRWESRQPGYAGQSSGLRRLEMSASTDLLAPVRLAARLQDTAEGTAWSWPRRLTREWQLRLAGRSGSVGYGLEYGHKAEGDAGSNTDRLTDQVRLYLTHSGPRRAYLFHSLAAEAVDEAGGRRQGAVLRYGLHAFFPSSSGSLAPFVQVEYPLDAGEGLRPVELSGGVRLEQSLSPALSAGLKLELQPSGAATHLAALELRYQPGSGPSLHLRAEAGRTAQGPWSWTLKAGYEAPFEVPVGRRSDVGQLSGRIVDERGRGMAGVVVRLGSLSTLTDPEGRFSFPAVSPGVYYLTLRADQLGPRRLTVPPTPWRVEVQPGSRVEQEFQALTAARVMGTVRLVRPSGPTLQEGLLVGGAEPARPEWLAGLTVEAVGESATLRVTTDARGTFAFDPLAPGTYRIRVRPEGLPALHAVEPSEVAVTLGPGEEHSVSFTLQPIVRQVEVIEGGELVPEPAR